MQLEQKMWKIDITSQHIDIDIVHNLFFSVWVINKERSLWYKMTVHVVCMQDPYSSETVDLSKELSSSTSRSLKERFMSIGLFSKLSGVKLRTGTKKVWPVIFLLY